MRSVATKTCAAGAVALVLAACGGGVGAGGVAPDAGPDAASGGSSGTGASGGSSGLGGNAGSGGGVDACIAIPIPLDQVVAGYALLVDRSASMQDSGKWGGVSAALESFVTQTGGVSASASLTFFPVPPAVPSPTACTVDADCGIYGPCVPGFNQCSGALYGDDSCVAADYQTPAVAMSPLPSFEMQQALQQIAPNGGSTPMAPALEGVLADASDYASSHPAEQVAVILVTDGAPTNCIGNDLDAVAKAAATGFGGIPSVSTYVIGVDTPTSLDAVAQAGGTGTATVVSALSAQAQTSAALDAIQKDLGCTYALPSNVPSAGLIAQLVVAGVAQPLPLVTDASACSGAGAYLVSGASETRLMLCPVSCDASSQPGSSVEVMGGC
jgi:hypothetical protein